MRHALLLLAAALALAGCSRPEAPPVVLTAPVPAQGKLVAPVSVTAAVGARSVTLTFRFERAAAGAVAGVQGLDGLELGAVGELPARDYRAGDTATLVVPLASAAGTLAVSTQGTFAGLPMSRAVTFALGAEARAVPEPGRVVQTDQGPLKALPAAEVR